MTTSLKDIGCCIIIVLLVGLLLGTQPNSVLGIPNTVTTVSINTSSSGEQQLIAAVNGQSIYITHYHILMSGTTTVSLDYGTGVNCGTGTTTIDGTMDFTAQTGISAGIGFGAVDVIPPGNALCINNTNAIHVGGSLSYQQGQ